MVAMDGRDLKWSTHAEVVQLIRQASGDFTLMVVTPLDKEEPVSPATATRLSAMAVQTPGQIGTQRL